MNDDTFDAPPELVLGILREMATTRDLLAAQIETAEWKAAALLERSRNSHDTGADGDAGDGKGDV